jgi:peptidyl-prolyl cis-trans isomerase B (cyclophilin B)
VSVKRNHSDRPYEDQKIKTATVESFGVDYEEVEKI